MAFGNSILPPTPQQQNLFNAGIGQALQPQGGGFWDSLIANPNAQMALLQAANRFLNPQSRNTGGQISDALLTGLQSYQSGVSADRQRDFQRETTERKLSQGDRRLDISEKGLEQEGDQFESQMDLRWAQNRLDEEELEAKKELWQGQLEKYKADVDRIRDKVSGGSGSLTGDERIINNLASILASNDVPEAQAYANAVDIVKGSAGNKGKAKAKLYENFAFLAQDEEGQQLLNRLESQIESTNFGTASEAVNQAVGGGEQEIAPNVTQSDVQAAMESLNRRNGTQLTFDALTEVQQNNLIEQIQKIKQEQAQGQ